MDGGGWDGAEELREQIKRAKAQLEHIKKWLNEGRPLEEIRHAIDHALAELS